MITSMIIFSNYILIILSQSIFLAIISLCPLRLDISLSLLSLISLPLLDLSLLSPLSPGREQREIGKGREQKDRRERAEKVKYLEGEGKERDNC